MIVRITQIVFLALVVYFFVHSTKASAEPIPAGFESACRSVGGEPWQSRNGERVGCLFGRDSTFIKTIESLNQAQQQAGEAAASLVSAGAASIKEGIAGGK
ncbi:hypothetical protein MIZ01_1598 [Sideroxyarcus emersonii]|uniref:Uncharacterized protein n=1 Tax=Sideroxyarcus emersonii TaxID=2764705 RepID=A0AAN2BZH3_9PROT|nr:hypothetical protein [Sideroxyarcus emersonii]BCK87802.1 hypothetical protein MIZ01_1598 [Sideroxyarcus emersonii]